MLKLIVGKIGLQNLQFLLQVLKMKLKKMNIVQTFIYFSN